MEYFDLVDENNEPTGEVASRAECHDPSKRHIHRDIHVVIFNSRREILLKKRSMNKDLYPGAWESSTTGHVDQGESREEAALRELFEELNISDAILKFVADFKNFSEIERQWSRLYVCIHDGPFTINDEAVETRLIPLNELPAFIASHDFTPGSMLALHTFLEKGLSELLTNQTAE